MSLLTLINHKTFRTGMLVGVLELCHRDTFCNRGAFWNEGAGVYWNRCVRLIGIGVLFGIGTLINSQQGLLITKGVLLHHVKAIWYDLIVCCKD